MMRPKGAIFTDLLYNEDKLEFSVRNNFGYRHPRQNFDYCHPEQARKGAPKDLAPSVYKPKLDPSTTCLTDSRRLSVHTPLRMTARGGMIAP